MRKSINGSALTSGMVNTAKSMRNPQRFARLPPTNANRPEIYSMRVNVVNRKTDVHKDASDWQGGLTGLIQLGTFKGKENIGGLATRRLIKTSK